MKALAAWGLWLVAALGLGLAAVAVSVRDPLPADAPSSVFSAARAMADVRLVGAEPHPMGSAANDRVRAALLARMTAMGLSPQVREGVGVYAYKDGSGVSAGTVRSLVGVVPGRDRTTPALALMAHYDSVPNSPGAADDAAGVAAVLEIARALQAAGPHARDVLVILTDGEEPGLLGAEALFRDPAVRWRIGAVLNFDTRGDAGRTAMFETGPGDAETIRLYARTARAPFANSLTGYIMRVLPNDTDFTHARRAGLPGLNFAFTGDQLAYHTPIATPAHLSQQSLQNMGDQAAPAALALADAPALPARGEDLAYLDVFGLGVLAYPTLAGWAVVLGAGLLLTLAWARLRRDPARRDEAGGFAVLRGAVVAVAATAAALLGGLVAGRALDGGGYVSGYRLYRDFDRLFWGAGLLAAGAALIVLVAAAKGRGRVRLAAAVVVATLLSFVWRGFDGLSLGLALGVAAAVLWAARRPLAPWSGWLGATLALGLVALVLQALAPLAAPVAAWPFLLAATGASVCALVPRRAEGAAFAVAGGLAVIALAALGAVANALFTAVGPGMPAVPAPFVLLLLPVLAPFAYAWARRRRTADVAAGGIAVGAGLLWMVAHAQGTAARPALALALEVVDAAGAQHRVAPGPRLEGWPRAVVTTGGAMLVRTALPPLFGEPVWSSPAYGPAVAAPTLTLVRSGGRVMLTARATGGGRALRIFLRSPGAISGLSVQGRSVPVVGAPGRWTPIAYAAPPPEGVVLTFTAGPVEAQVFEQRDGWPPGAAIPPRPTTLIPFADSDTTLVGARAAAP